VRARAMSRATISFALVALGEAGGASVRAMGDYYTGDSLPPSLIKPGRFRKRQRSIGPKLPT
jgi:hypothetical protein